MDQRAKEAVEEFLSELGDVIDFYIGWGNELGWEPFSEDDAEMVLQLAERMLEAGKSDEYEIDIDDEEIDEL